MQLLKIYMVSFLTVILVSVFECSTVEAEESKSYGIADKTTELQNELIHSAGKVVVLPAGSSFKVSGLTIPDNTTVIGYGAKIYNDTKHRTLLTVGNGVKIYGLELQGAGNKAADTAGVGIKIKGAKATSYVRNVVIEDCFIHDIGFYGIEAQFAEGVSVKNTVIEDVGYAGIGGLSVKNTHINKSHIKRVSPGVKGNAYGVFFSRAGANNSNLRDYPRSMNSSVTNTIIEDIPLWEALDTHGGENITFNYNTIKNTKVGIAFVNAKGNEGKEVFGSQKCTAKGNKIDGIGKGYGIVVAGASSNHARDCTIENNQIKNAGQQGNTISGAIQASYTQNLIIKGNSLINCYANGIHLYIRNKQFMVTKNTIQDVQDRSYVATSAIAFRSNYNEGTISENILSRKNKSLNKYVAARGINISIKTNMKLWIGKNTNTCVIPIAGGDGRHVTLAAPL
ncbi:right-handed parallel beta-helix repeat-containing protein [Pseudobacillus sp. 179-B 2D1 NHS]|uniref:right-handed parallel beta-helix repeat-containing protein n=1 Tax=Pseudobacillus sp. 179-B 2D1 NHS TaxID=3374292 RepID=UPI00387A3917